jgi:hypothetical protein
MSIYTEKSKQADYFDYDDNDYYCPTPAVGGKKAEKIRKDPTKHYPNKDEASELRKIMSSTGLTEEEVRKDKKYRIQLSNAQKEGQKPKRTETERTFQRLIKLACKHTGLTPQHPDTIKALQEILNKRSKGYFSYSFLRTNNLNAETVVKNYAKK